MQIDTRYDIGERVFIVINESNYKMCECCGGAVEKTESVKKAGEIIDVRFVRHKTVPNNVEVAYSVKAGGLTYLVREEQIAEFR